MFHVGEYQSHPTWSVWKSSLLFGVNAIRAIGGGLPMHEIDPTAAESFMISYLKQHNINDWNAFETFCATHGGALVQPWRP